MGQKKNLLFFGIASLIGHAIFAALLSGSIMDNKVVKLSSIAKPQPLQISMAREIKPEAKKNTVDKNPEPKVIPKKPESPKESSQHLNKPDINIVKNTQAENISLRSNPKSLSQPSREEDSAKTLELVKAKNAMIHEKLVALINIRKKYPTFAARRGWQGTVQLGLRIESNGKFSQVRVLKTSGYSILDEAALTMLTSANHLNGVEVWLDGSYFDTMLPVEYQLIGG